MNGIIFDLDGTLVDSSSDITLHLNATLKRIAPEARSLKKQEVEYLIGGGMKDIIIKGIKEIGLSPDETLPDADTIERGLAFYRDTYHAQPVATSTLYEGVAEMLAALKQQGFRLGICTNKREDTACDVLRHFNLLHYFDIIVGGDTTEERKPSAKPMLAAVEGLNLAPCDCIMVGDSKADFGSARAAEVAIILVNWGYSAIDVNSLGADAVISSYGEMISVLASLARDARIQSP